MPDGYVYVTGSSGMSLADPLGFINVDCFLERNFPPPITYIAVCSTTLEILGYFKHADTALFLACKLIVISSQLHINGFLTKPVESAECHLW